jgi:small subunit ribosomal protein S6
MNNYEAMFIFKSDPDKDKTQQLCNQINEVITKNKGSVVSSEIWAEKRKLTFPIKKHREGTYYLLKFNALPQDISKINQEYRLNENILRVLITRL